MSLFPTKEEKAYSKGYEDGLIAGRAEQREAAAAYVATMTGLATYDRLRVARAIREQEIE